MENQIGSATSGVYYLKWKGYGVHLTNRISNLLQEEQFADVTLACDGNYIRAHKLLLSLCSPYFKKLFEIHSPEKSNTIVILNHVRFSDLESILSFVYTGQVHVHQTDLSSFLQTGELLQIEGLANSSENSSEKTASNPTSVSGQGYESSEFRTNQSGDISSVQPVSTDLNRSTHSSYPCRSPTRATSSSQSSSNSASNKRFKSSTSSTALSNHDSLPNPYFSSQDQSQLRQSHLSQQIEGNDHRNQDDTLEQLCSPSQNIEEDPLADNSYGTMVTHRIVDQKHSIGQEKELEETEVDLGLLKTENIVMDIKDSEDESMKDNQSPGQVGDQGFLSNLLVETVEGNHERGFDFYTEANAVESPIASTSGTATVMVSSTPPVFEAVKGRNANRGNGKLTGKLGRKSRRDGMTKKGTQKKSNAVQFKKYCGYCGNAFNRDYLRTHIREVHSTVKSAVTCPTCGNTYKSLQCYKVHRYRCKVAQSKGAKPEQLDGSM